MGDWTANFRNVSPSGDPLEHVPGILSVTTLADTAALPDTLSEALLRLNGRASNRDVCRSLTDQLPDADERLKSALLDVADAADRSGLANAYHNPIHSRDVGVVLVNLMRLEAFLATGSAVVAADALLIGCCAAFGHDIGHDGTHGSEPYRLEKIAAEQVGGILQRRGVAPESVRRVCCAILTTDVQNGYDALDQAQRNALSLPAGSPEALATLADRYTRDMACLLRDADVMQSAGLTPEDHDRQTSRLEQERGIPEHSMGVRGADLFLRDVIRGRFLSKAGRVFQPRLDRLMQLNNIRAEVGDCAEGLAAFDSEG